MTGIVSKIDDLVGVKEPVEVVDGVVVEDDINDGRTRQCQECGALYLNSKKHRDFHLRLDSIERRVKKRPSL